MADPGFVHEAVHEEAVSGKTAEKQLGIVGKSSLAGAGEYLRAIQEECHHAIGLTDGRMEQVPIAERHDVVGGGGLFAGAPNAAGEIYPVIGKLERIDAKRETSVAKTAELVCPD